MKKRIKNIEIVHVVAWDADTTFVIRITGRITRETAHYRLVPMRARKPKVVVEDAEPAIGPDR